MEPRCDRCSYWDQSDRESFGLRRCRYAVILWNASEWNDPSCDWALKAEFADRKAFTQDWSDYRADLYTMPDFYCAGFKPTA